MLVPKSLKFTQCQGLVIRIYILKTPEMVKLAQCYHLYLPTKTGPRTLTFSIMLVCIHNYRYPCKSIHKKIWCTPMRSHCDNSVYDCFWNHDYNYLLASNWVYLVILEYEIKILYTGIIKILKFTQSLLFNSSHDDQHNSNWENRRQQYPANHSIGVWLINHLPILVIFLHLIAFRYKSIY